MKTLNITGMLGWDKLASSSQLLANEKIWILMTRYLSKEKFATCNQLCIGTLYLSFENLATEIAASFSNGKEPVTCN